MRWISLYSYCTSQTDDSDLKAVLLCISLVTIYSISDSYRKQNKQMRAPKATYYAVITQDERFEEETYCMCLCIVLKCIVGIQSGYSHYVPDDAGTIRAGSDTLFVITLDFDTSDSGFVLRHGLQQPVAMWLQLPNAHLQQVNPKLIQPYRRSRYTSDMTLEEPSVIFVSNILKLFFLKFF